MKKRIKFKAVKLSQNEPYYGTIKKVELDENVGRIRIFTELDDVPEELFMKSLKYSENLASQTGRFFEEMGALDENNELDLECLEDLSVQVTLNQGQGGIWYVNEMLLVEEETEDSPFDEEDDDDDIDFDDDEEEDDE